MTGTKIIRRILLVTVVALTAYYFYPEEPLPAGVKKDSLLVIKSERKMMAYSKGRLVRIYRISLGRHPKGDKQFEGDKKTPEGIYYINAKNPNSGYHKNLGISYPDAGDVALSKKLGKSTGGDVKIHGLRNGTGFIGKFQRWWDWTAGCIALTDQEVDELYSAVDVGTLIEIRP